MKVLFVTSLAQDHLASLLWDGLQEVLGEPHVVDAVGCPWLHAGESDPAQDTGNSRVGARLREKTGDYDLVVFHSCLDRDGPVAGAQAWAELLKPGGKTAWVEDWDAAWQVVPPPFRPDGYFRKEIQPGFSYPYDPVPLGYAAPSRWFLPDTLTWERPLDVSWVGNPTTCHPARPHLRWQMLEGIFRCRRRHACVVATRRLGIDFYWQTLRQSKLALCPAAADGADSLRTYEAVAAGCVPVFVGYPNHVREWFPPELIYHCQPETVAEHIDEALSHDLDSKRAALWDWSREHHTTAARARRVLRALGVRE